MSQLAPRLTNYAAYVDPDTGRPRIGHLDLATRAVQPLSFISGTPVGDLYQVIATSAESIVAAGRPLASATILPPISGRDVLAVGKNYMEHAREFNSSGFDSSDKVDRPSHPVIFTKRATSIVADGAEIEPHGNFTTTLDYEGELGVIVGRAGLHIALEDAWDYVWGYTIINDVTARERQRDHKQFFLGKSADTFCPMGPIAVPKEDLAATLRVQTHVNGELRQNATTDDLIFSIPELISTLSSGMTLQPGDVLATGTPAGVGLGLKPPVYLQPGDEISVSIDGLGTLRNKVAQPQINGAKTTSRVPPADAFPLTNANRSLGGTIGLTRINGKPLHYQHRGSIGTGVADGDQKPIIIFVHGLGGTLDVWTPIIDTLGLDESSPSRIGQTSASLHLFDLEGHGLSPTHPLRPVTIASLAADIAGVFSEAGVSPTRPAVIVAHSLGCLAAVRFALDHPDHQASIKKLVLLGPPSSPLPAFSAAGLRTRAALVRRQGMGSIVDAAVSATISTHTHTKNPLAVAAVRLSLLTQDPEAYAKVCQALAASEADALPLEDLQVPTLVVTGQEDEVSPPDVAKQYAERLPHGRHVVLPQTGHWSMYENIEGVAQAVKAFVLY
ncbi:5-carboxymethyl-2-hydroxymuconate delta-isomerase [Grosmannia clavigera kw1407]|uniref:5-carboxymethyl-2-hydroxymuconate delta-isomerase n=1 Tax=Grosmannia clavigera (strain kw1407 / UAMH 11150) TaxID=655863 RepID=F0XQF2_GROCL|nr:5-carboxymethyl-2-hydroxymuconate delta-isomerase [Grosmannia clavigera kw1407]EFX00476.1 5-carboxymethyl-2-hydroxymuconate delta-isomerase [Grosmannia clavigera kw1407]